MSVVTRFLRRPALSVAALLGTVSALLPVSAAEPTWPAVTNQTKPWSRWWWLGNILDDRDVTTLMTGYAAAGLGGLEITPIYGVRGYEDRFLPFLSPPFLDRFEHVLKEGRRLDLGIDLATGTGWPFGGPWIGPEHASKYLAHRTFTVAAGERLSEPVSLLQKPVVRVAGPRKVTLAELKAPVTANADLQDLALDQVRFEQPLPLITLQAVSAGGERLDLTTRVSAEGRLDWTAPAGSGAWTLYALFTGDHGKLVERAGPGGEGNVIDHFSAAALKQFLTRFDEAFSGRDLRGLRAFFNDSYEVDDAQGESDWTPRFFEEFQQRRGYDLRAHLDALLATTPDDRGRRVLGDYRETLSDLLLEQFTRPWQAWARGRGALIRNQGHGSPANLLDLYAASDIPEQEGSDVLAIKLASSAAHVSGKPLASAEAATWLNEHFLGTLAEVKHAVDLFFLGGINHVCYHGTAYSPPGDTWPGFHFYAAVELNPSNPIWRDFPALNAYVTRVQSFLQSGTPDEEVLLYYTIHDRWAVRGPGALPHFHGRANEVPGAYETGAALVAAGHGFDFVSDRLLAGVSVAADGSLRSGDATYRALVVPPTGLIPLETWQRLLAFVEKGATLVVKDALPADVTGFRDLERRRGELQALNAALSKAAQAKNGASEIRHGRGRILLGGDVPVLLGQAGVARETWATAGLRFVRRRHADGHHYFVLNTARAPFAGWLPLSTPARDLAVFDPMTGAAGRAVSRERGNGREVWLELAPGEARLVQTSTTQAFDGATAPAWRAAGEPQAVGGPWSVTFTSGGPALPGPVADLATLRSWTEFAGEPGKIFGGTAVYRIALARPAASATAWQLDLGQVAESAQVTFNGRDLGTVFTAPFRVTIPADLWRADNVVEIAVTNLAANRIADLDRRGVPWKKFYNTNMPARRGENRGPDGLFSAARWAPRASGLLGPVQLTPLLPAFTANP